MRLSFSTLSSILFIIFLPFFLFFSFLRTGRTEDSKDFIATLVVYIRTHRCWREFLRCRGGHRSKYFFFLFFFINCHVNIPFDIFIPRSFFFSPLLSVLARLARFATHEARCVMQFRVGGGSGGIEDEDVDKGG